MQTWSDVLNFIKINLGAPLNRLEISDDDVVKNQHVAGIVVQNQRATIACLIDHCVVENAHVVTTKFG